MQDNKGILLESGTNEFEIIEFTVGGVFYGINVAKVREIINPLPVTPLANSHPNIDGLFTLRGKVVPLVSLSKCLASKQVTETHKVIVCEINGVFTAFKVDDVSRIYRISWTQMEPPPNVSGSELVVGVVKMSDRLIILLDFEKILADINPEINKKLTAMPASTPNLVTIRKTKTILVAEDSHMLRELLLGTLHNAGYHTIATENGQMAWDKLLSLAASGTDIHDIIQLIITDIEMPQMDGHHLLKRIKENDKLASLPVVIFSSLINEEMKIKGQALGAYAQITKPEIEQLIGIIDKKIAV